MTKRNKIDAAFYQDACDMLTFVDTVVMDGKQAIVTLRNARKV